MEYKKYSSYYELFPVDDRFYFTAKFRPWATDIVQSSSAAVKTATSSSNKEPSKFAPSPWNPRPRPETMYGSNGVQSSSNAYKPADSSSKKEPSKFAPSPWNPRPETMYGSNGVQSSSNAYKPADSSSKKEPSKYAPSPWNPRPRPETMCGSNGAQSSSTTETPETSSSKLEPFMPVPTYWSPGPERLYRSHDAQSSDTTYRHEASSSNAEPSKPVPNHLNSRPETMYRSNDAQSSDTTYKHEASSSNAEPSKPVPNHLNSRPETMYRSHDAQSSYTTYRHEASSSNAEPSKPVPNHLNSRPETMNETKPVANNNLGQYANLVLKTNHFEEFLTHKSCTFSIMLEGRCLLIEFKHLQIQSAGPSGSYHQVYQTHYADRIDCTFYPRESGVFVVNVIIHKCYHIRGSPANIVVSKDDVPRNPVITQPLCLFSTPTPPYPIPTIFRKPSAICFNSKTQEFIIADTGFHEILVYGLDGGLKFSFGGVGSAEGKFTRPRDVACNKGGDLIYVADTSNHRIQIFSAQGQFKSTFGKYGKQHCEFQFPWGIAISPDDSLLAVGDAKKYRIQIFNLQGTRVWKNRTSPLPYVMGTIYPRRLAFNPTGEFLYVTDFEKNGVYKLCVHDAVPRDRRCSCEFSCFCLIPLGILSKPSGITVDQGGDIVLCDPRNQSLQIYKPNGEPTKAISCIRSHLCTATAKAREFPVDVAVMDSGQLAVLDSSGTVRFF